MAARLDRQIVVKKGLTWTEAALRLQSSVSSVQRWVNDGTLTLLDDGSIDPLNFEDHAAEAGEKNFVHWRKVNEEYTAKLKNLSYDLKTGIQVDRGVVEHSVATAFTVCSEGLKGLPSRLAPLCFGAATERDVHNLLFAACDTLLLSLATALEAYADTAESEAVDEEEQASA